MRVRVTDKGKKLVEEMISIAGSEEKLRKILLKIHEKEKLAQNSG